jgi:hypothetical protein
MYFLRYNGKIRGPFAADHLERLLAQGRVPHTAEVSLDRYSWGPLSNRPYLAPSAVPAQPPLLDALPLEPVAETEDFVVHLDTPSGSPAADPADMLGELDWSKWSDPE